VSAPINFSPLIYAAAPLGMPRENTRTRTRVLQPPPSSLLSPVSSLPFSHPCVLYKFPDRALTCRIPFSKEIGNLFSEYTSRLLARHIFWRSIARARERFNFAI